MPTDRDLPRLSREFISIDVDHEVPDLRALLDDPTPAYVLVTDPSSDDDVFVLDVARVRALVDEDDEDDEDETDREGDEEERHRRWTGGDLVRALDLAPSVVVHLTSGDVDHTVRAPDVVDRVLRSGMVVTLDDEVSAVLGAVGADAPPGRAFDELRFHAADQGVEAAAFRGGDQLDLVRAPVLAEAAADEPDVTGLQVIVPGQVSYGGVVTLLARLTRPGEDLPDIDFEATAGQLVSVVAWPQEGVRITGSDTATLTVAETGDEVGRIDLEITSPARASLVVGAFRDQTFLGSALVEMRVTVTPGVMAAAERATVLPLSRGQAPESDLAVHVVDTSDTTGERGFRFVAIQRGEPPVTFPFRKVTGDAATYLAPLFAGISAALEEPGPGQPPATTSPEAIVRTIGLTLGEDLLPPQLMRFLAEHRDTLHSVVVHSEEGLLPWELCMLTRQDPDGRVQELGFLCELFELTRWRPRLPARQQLTMSSIGVIAPADSGLRSRKDEVAMLDGLASQRRTVSSVRATTADVMEMLEAGSFDVIHFIGHGALQDPANASSARVVLSGSSFLEAASVKGAARNFGRTGPLVFLNACRLGSASPGLVGPAGFASAMLEAGSAAFVGAHWDVVDEKAHEFASALYARLVAGEPIGRAALAARLAIKDPDDPTWLAYTVFASPTAALTGE